MKFKHFLSFLIVMALVLGMVGCTTEEVSYEDDLEDKAPISIYLLSDYFKIEHFVINYNKLPKENQRLVKSTKFPIEESEIMYDQLLKEISVGKGPDIIYIDQSTHRYMDVCKIAGQNAFADMDILIEQDGEFDLDDYSTMVLDTGIVDGKRIMMPISYKVDYLIGVEECFEKNGLDIPDKLTMDAYLSLMEAYHQTRSHEPALLGIDPVYLLAEYIKVDQPIEKSDELRRLFAVLKEETLRMRRDPSYVDDFRRWKKYWPLQHPYEIGYNPIIGYLGFFMENNLMFKRSHAETYNTFERLFEYYNLFLVNGGNAFILEQPFKSNSPNKAYAEKFLAININSKHKNEAFDFIKYMMSERINYDKTAGSSLPIRLECFEFAIEDLLDGFCCFNNCLSLFNDPIFDQVQLPKEMVDQVITYVESAETCEFIGQFEYVYHNVINESIQSYYDDHITYDQMIDEINNRLVIYYSE